MCKALRDELRNPLTCSVSGVPNPFSLPDMSGTTCLSRIFLHSLWKAHVIRCHSQHVLTYQSIQYRLNPRLCQVKSNSKTAQHLTQAFSTNLARPKFVHLKRKFSSENHTCLSGSAHLREKLAHLYKQPAFTFLSYHYLLAGQSI